MEARHLYSPNLNEYLVQLSYDKAEIMQHIRPDEFAREAQRLLAEKIAQKLFESIEPKLMGLINVSE